MDKMKIIKMVVILAAIVVIAGGLSRFMGRNSLSLAEYAEQNGKTQAHESSKDQESPSATRFPQEGTSSPGLREETPMPSPDSPAGTGMPSSTEPPREESSPSRENQETVSRLTGASLNGDTFLEERVLLEEGFYYEPLSDNLRRYMTGISYPSDHSGEGGFQPEITFQELRYVHILHYDFEGNPVEGELVCNELIAQDLVEIFYELYRNEYQLEKVLLIDEYDGDDNASMADNNTSCFNYRLVEGSSHLSKHALGLAVDVNPFYNPYITYEKDGPQKVSPASAQAYADRSSSFPYKINEDDLCYKLFLQHGFTWGGNWNSVKDYQHFQKAAAVQTDS